MEVNLHIYSGIGNLIAIVDGIRADLHISSKEVDHVYNFHGVNFDQLIILLPPSDPQNDLDVKIFNNDGSIASNCINGARCVGRFIKDNSLLASNKFKVKTDGGLWELDNVENNIFSAAFEAKAEIITKKVEAKGIELSLDCINLGNLHGVTFENKQLDMRFLAIGESLQRNISFPDGINFGVAEKINKNEVNLRVYERGAGETLACGSGACAVAMVGILQEKLATPVKVNFQSGSLLIDYDRETEIISAQGLTEFIETKIIKIDV